MREENRRKYSSGWKRKVRNTAMAATFFLAVTMILVFSFCKNREQGNSAFSGEEQEPQAAASLPEPTKEAQTELQMEEQESPSVEAEQVSQPVPEKEPPQEPSGLWQPVPTMFMQEPSAPMPNIAVVQDTAADIEAENIAFTPLPKIEPELPVKAALLTDAATGKILYGYHAYEQITPASVTKLMTMLLALERGKLDDVLTVTDTALNVGHWDAVMCGFRSGDKVTLYDVLHGMMLGSGNDAAAMVAEYISGSVEEFVILMNERAAELGANCTNFANPHGLPNDEHLTSAYDISLVMQELLKHEEFFEIASKERYTSYYKNAKGASVSLTFRNTNQYMAGRYELADGIELLAGKTGTTSKAGKCLTLFVRAQDGKLYLAELFGAETLDDLYFFMNQLLEIINMVTG